MTLKEVLAVLAANNIRLGLEQDNLKIRAAKGAITPEIKALLIEYKPQLLAWITSKQSEKESLAPIPRRENESERPLSFTQQRLWFIAQLSPEDASYNVPAALKIRGNLDIPVLQRVFDEIVRRHEILRSNFSNVQGEAQQQVKETLAVPLAVETLPAQHNTGEALDKALLQLAREEAARPFDLANEPLIRLRLIQLPATVEAGTAESPEYLLLLNLHHIITDGWSNGVLMQEVSSLYQAYINEQPSPLAELPIQYADYAAWQRQYLSESLLAQKLAFWKERLADLPVLELPADRPRPVQRSGRGQQLNFTVPAEVSAKLKQLAQQHSTTLFTVLMAAFKTLLMRYTGQEDICVGTPVAGRNRAELTDLIGFFINTLALRSDLSGDPTFVELLERESQGMRSAQEHQDVPFESIVESLGLSRDMSITPVFQTLLVLQNAPMAEQLPQAGLSFEMLASDTQSAKFDLTFNMKEYADHLIGSAEFDTDLFNESSIKGMTEHFNTLLAGIADNPRQNLSQLPLLSPQERQQILVDWNKTRAIYPRNMSMASQFEQQAARRGDEIAVDFPDQQLSYSQLDQRASKLAHYLAAQGIKRGDRVAICLDRSIDMVIGILAILKLNAAYVPLDPHYPEDRLAFMLEDTQAALIISVSANLQRLQDLPIEKLPEVLLLDKQEAELALQPDNWQTDKDNAQGEQLAYIMYTSGSTGRPKGVMIPQRAIIRLVKNTNFVDLGPDDATGHISNVCFDAATLEFWGALLNGGRIIGISKEMLLDRAAFEARLREKRVTTMFITVTLFNLYVSEAPGMFSSVKNLLVGGEALDPNKIRQVLADKPPARLMNGYGPTENTTFTTWYEISSLGKEVRSVPLGYPLANTTTYILDKNRQPVPVGVPGELCTGGDGVGLGYLNREDLNAEKFVPDPFSDKPGALMYRTGDVCRWLADGRIEMLGRVDDQVKIRGFRIEPGEIDNVLGQIAGVKECAVIVRNDHGDKYLAAYVVASSAQGPDQPFASIDELVNHIRSNLQEQLPAYMQPTAIVVLDELPLTSNGKLDHRALPQPTIEQMSSAEYIAPRNALEQELAQIWCEILGIEKVGIKDNFFELGGHSLMATRVTAHIKEKLQCELPLQILFEGPTIETLAKHIELAEAQNESVVPALTIFDRSSLLTGIPLSYAQQRLWIIDQIQPGSAMYNIPAAIKISSELNTAVLQRVFATIVARHESLRTNFEGNDDSSCQVVKPAGDWELPIFEMDSDPDLLKQRAVAFMLAPFDLTADSLFRAQLIKLRDSAKPEYVLLACIHHIIADGWSMDVLLHEIVTLYQAFSKGEASPLPELGLQYPDYALWQRNWLQGDVLQNQIDYWARQLANAPVLELPTDHPRPARMNAHGRITDFSLSADLSARLRKLSKAQGSTLYMTLLAAFQVLLHRYSGQHDISVGSPIANRTQHALEPMIGFFVNTLVMRNQIDSKQRFSDFLQQVRKTTLEAYQHQDAPFELVVENLQIPRTLSVTPLFQVMLSLQNATAFSGGDASVNVGELNFSPLLSENHREVATKFDLTMNLYDEIEGISGTLEYRAYLFEAETIQQLLAHFTQLLESIVEQPNQSIGGLALLSAHERQRLVIDYNQTQQDFPSDNSVTGMIAGHAKTNPQAKAVCFDEQTFSYAQLERRANQIANWLQSKGAQQGDFVGLYSQRSAMTVCALLGIWKAGCVYTPLDPNHPKDRILYMLDDARLRWVLTQSPLQTILPEETQTLLIDQPELLDTLPDTPVQVEPDDSDLAYVIYTSGTTGQAKGVTIKYHSLLNLAYALQQDIYAGLPVDRPLRVTVNASLVFDASMQQLIQLVFGHTLYPVPEDIRLDPAAMMAFFRDNAIDVLDCTPSQLTAITEGMDDQQLALLPKRILVGGEAVSVSLWEKLRYCAEQFGVESFNVYGPTECTVDCTWISVRESASATIGRPIANTQCFILDENLQLAPQGAIGELCVGGAGLSPGYLHREQLTAQRFIKNPFGEGRLYRSGDLVRYRPDGCINYVGRIDHQVKIRGFRIELGEIEALLHQHSGIKDAVVSTILDNSVIVAYIVPLGETAPDDKQLRNDLKQSLPDYMIPAAFVELQAIPLTVNGKLDRAALPVPELLGSNSEYVEAQSAVEKQLVPLWQDLLQLSQVSRYENFFESGGNSLLAIRLLTRMRDQFDVEIPVSMIFEMPVLANMASYIENILWARQDSDFDSSESDEDREEFEL